MLADSAADQAAEKAVIATFNSKLVTYISNFKGNNSGVRRLYSILSDKTKHIIQVQTWLWDSNAAFTTVLNNPSAYGFVDATSYGNTGDFWG